MSSDLRKRKKDPNVNNVPSQEAVGEKKDKKEKSWPFWYCCFKKVVIVLLVVVLLLAVKVYRDNEMVTRQEAALRSLGNEGLFLFSSLDTDKDMFISPDEFKPIAEKLTGVSPTSDYEEEEALDPNGETLTIAAHYQPLLMETMTKSKDGFLGITQSALSGLRNWTSASLPSNMFFARQFKTFLPPKNKLDVGNPWWILPSELNIFTGYLPNNRVYPPAPKGKEVIIHKLLSMFHPRPFIKTRFAPQGSVACIRAVSDFYYDIVFRIHAEFQLNEPPNFPFWFTPAQFTGNIVISKDASHVRHFYVFVPNNRSLNVDMEWLYGASESSNMEVDIGYLPLMELESFGPSIPTVIFDENGEVIDSRHAGGEPIEFVFEDINWQSEISWQEAAKKLEVTMYPFKKVSYHPFTEAFDKAYAEKKLVHSVLLWGALDDQSC
uniref:EF-hand domain-containing protein n=1 Tax=Leptobrachium leishanense TaxID=445787 RepID=A0A8C5QVC9_9ANUR